ncbi:TetR/AcrR family transcriptional regulator [Mycolicibacterium sp.]|uniref:TetR/AcrR family transcriptional regulator n=1 Tax=Mycolicibacterium sp. TaxID=2320850 RepID=UPI001A19B20B|nr:TetR/AcrR family transcriptional regulator [Mycolicibacterium sp.]MBJ7337235.1 TetR/AcrR family transcriptional regulator [Mycolicibacterium sp.]
MLTAARELVVVSGLDATMDQIAESSGVSRRTLFRYFDSREKLIAASFAAGMADFGRELPTYDGDLEQWLRALCDATHRMNATIGLGYFELTWRSDLPPELATMERKLRRARRRDMNGVARKLWHAVGGLGDAPAMLGATVAAQLSAFFTAAVMTDVGPRWQTAADLAYDGILRTLREEQASVGRG